jgi:hypothetical protein
VLHSRRPCGLPLLESRYIRNSAGMVMPICNHDSVKLLSLVRRSCIPSVREKPTSTSLIFRPFSGPSIIRVDDLTRHFFPPSIFSSSSTLVLNLIRGSTSNVFEKLWRYSPMTRTLTKSSVPSFHGCPFSSCKGVGMLFLSPS